MKFSLGIIQYPSKKFGLVGSIPLELTQRKQNSLGQEFRASLVWEKRSEVEETLTKLGYSSKDGLNYQKDGK